ncbi:rod shape-determining protein MreC [Desulfovibrio aminophilus]|nr:rod shape-determining protein MreC [Desulfovibrio aminophilus]
MKLKRIAVIVLTGLFVYLSLYTWNIRTGHLDRLAENTGLDAARLVLKPGTWVADQAVSFWRRYIHLIGLREENDRLRDEVDRLLMDNTSLREQARASARMEQLLGFTPAPDWVAEGARVIAHRLGPNALLETLVLDRGTLQGAGADQPVVTPRGVVGRILRAGLSASTVLLLHDVNSRIAVIGQNNRAAGVLAGRGPGREMELKYVNLNAPIEPGELLVTSGLSDSFPKGLPVARVLKVERSDLSLFLDITAEPLMDFEALEEVLVLRRRDAPPAAGGGI